MPALMLASSEVRKQLCLIEAPVRLLWLRLDADARLRPMVNPGG
jgi:hypothetical protein